MDFAKLARLSLRVGRIAETEPIPSLFLHPLLNDARWQPVRDNKTAATGFAGEPYEYLLAIAVRPGFPRRKCAWTPTTTAASATHSSVRRLEIVLSGGRPYSVDQLVYLLRGVDRAFQCDFTAPVFTVRHHDGRLATMLASQHLIREQQNRIVERCTASAS